MAIVAKLNNLRISARKVRLVADLIRRKPVEEAQTILRFAVKRSSPIILKLLNQAIANAKNNFKLDEKDLYVSKLTVDEGPKLKRWRPRARGSASPIEKKTSHITLVLESKNPTKKIEKGTGAKTEIKELTETKEQTPEIKTAKPKFNKGPEKTENIRQTKGQDKKRIFRRKSF